MKHYLAFNVVGVVALTALAGSPLLCQTMQPRRVTNPANETMSGRSAAKSVHIRGNPEAPVTLKEFGDFECPSCANLATFLDQLVKEYHPRVRLIFRNFSLPMHQFARDAALAAEGAGLQGRYWEMHDILFREQAVWSSATDGRLLFDTYAETLGLDLGQFRKDVKSDKVRERVESDQPARSRWESKPPRHCLSTNAKWDRMSGTRRGAQTCRGSGESKQLGLREKMTASRFRVILYAIAAIASLAAILGSESGIYFYAHRHSATGYIYTYG